LSVFGHVRVSSWSRQRLLSCCLRPVGLPACFILLTTLVYLGLPDPWSAVGRQRNLGILASERSAPQKGKHGLLFLLLFVHCGVCFCGAVAPGVTVALLGRFLPRLGPLAVASGPFFTSIVNGCLLGRRPVGPQLLD